MLDNRTQRSARDFDNIANNDTCISGETQQNELETWLKQHCDNSSLKFIFSASMLLPRRRFRHAGDTVKPIRSDSWNDYPTFSHRVLGLIHELKIQNVSFLSWDEHMNCYSRIEINQAGELRRDSETTTIRSVHCSGLYTHFPFANSGADDLMGERATR